jgi:hypothetical protein
MQLGHSLIYRFIDQNVLLAAMFLLAKYTGAEELEHD